MKPREAFAWCAFWIGLALAFNALIYFTMGSQPALEFLSGYLVEESLSVDNLFVFMLIFKYFQTPQKLYHRVLFWGVLGAIIMRALFIFGGIALITHFHWIIYIFGFFLLLMGAKMFKQKDEEIHPENNPILRILKKFMPITPDYRGHKFTVFENGRKYATPLLVVLIAIETTDLVFAVDSIPAILAITLDPFIVYTSNIFAILGLRALFFALVASMQHLHYLHYALGTILMFVGAKMLISPWIKIPIGYTLGFILSAIVIATVVSLLYPAAKSQD